MVGSTLWIDDLSFEGIFTGTFSPLFPNFTKAFPNPVKDVLTLSDIPSSATSIEVRDLTGRTVEVLKASDKVNVNVSLYNAGIYHYSVKDKNDQLLYSDKFNVIK